MRRPVDPGSSLSLPPPSLDDPCRADGHDVPAAATFLEFAELQSDKLPERAGHRVQAPDSPYQVDAALMSRRIGHIVTVPNPVLFLTVRKVDQATEVIEIPVLVPQITLRDIIEVHGMELLVPGPQVDRGALHRV